MPKYLGLDIATKTGFTILNDSGIETFGTINIDTVMNLPQRLNYLSNELNRLLETHKPDYCFIEEVIMGVSGPKTMRYLSRLNGVAIHTCYSILKDKVLLYEPSHWKKNSFPNLNGSSAKWQIQLECIRYFNIPIKLEFQEIDGFVESSQQAITEQSEYQKHLRQLINKGKVKKKKLTRSSDEWKNLNESMKAWETNIKESKLQAKKLKTEFLNEMKAISLDITAQTGMTEDVCDACGVALCGRTELTQ